MMQDIPHILVADDNPEIREIIKVLLSGEGYSVTEAKDGTDALTKIKKQEFDLIILDIMMPGMNGYETCQGIREQSNVPILFLSARTTDSDKILGFQRRGRLSGKAVFISGTDWPRKSFDPAVSRLSGQRTTGCSSPKTD